MSERLQACEQLLGCYISLRQKALSIAPEVLVRQFAEVQESVFEVVEYKNELQRARQQLILRRVHKQSLHKLLLEISRQSHAIMELTSTIAHLTHLRSTDFLVLVEEYRQQRAQTLPRQMPSWQLQIEELRECFEKIVRVEGGKTNSANEFEADYKAIKRVVKWRGEAAALKEELLDERIRQMEECLDSERALNAVLLKSSVEVEGKGGERDWGVYYGEYVKSEQELEDSCMVEIGKIRGETQEWRKKCQEEVREMEREKQEVEIKLEEVEKQKQEIEKQLKDVIKQKQEVGKQLKKVEKQKQEIKSQLKEVIKQKQEVEKQLKKVEKQKQEVEKQLKKVEKQKQEVGKQLKKVEKQKQEIKSQLKNVKKQKQEAEIINQQLKKQNLHLRTQNKQISDDEKKLYEQNVAFKTRLQKLEQQILIKQQQIQNITQLKNYFHLKNDQINETIMKNEDQIAKYTKNKTLRQQQMNLLSDENSLMKKQLQQIKTLNNKLCLELKESYQKIQQQKINLQFIEFNIRSQKQNKTVQNQQIIKQKSSSIIENRDEQLIKTTIQQLLNQGKVNRLLLLDQFAKRISLIM